MINYIIYEDEKYYINIYEEVIHKFMARGDDRYRIYKYKEYDEKVLSEIKRLTGQNIYIVDIEVKGKSGLDLAREIRKDKKTMNDQIIIVTAHQELVQNAYHKRILMVDFISKFDDLDEKIILCLREIYEIFNGNEYLSFKQDGELIRIPYNDILYIEKDKEAECVYIVTENNQYKYRNSILRIEKLLKKDLRFFRCHRSCIVNIYKITKINGSIPIIIFGNKSTHCLSREKKKELEELCMVGSVGNEC